jgi:HPt (histidine-containing phosphotransfer) domain-containing protein
MQAASYQPPNANVLDREDALARVGGDTELLAEIAGLFLVEYPRLLLELRIAMECRDALKLESAAHALKGSVANFGAKPAVELAHALERAGRAGDIELARNLIGGLEQVLAALHTELARL